MRGEWPWLLPEGRNVTRNVIYESRELDGTAIQVVPLMASTSGRCGTFVAKQGVDVFSGSSAVTLSTQKRDGTYCRKKMQVPFIELDAQEWGKLASDRTGDAGGWEQMHPEGLLPRAAELRKSLST